MFQAGDQVMVISCADKPRAKGKVGRIVDEVPPGPLTEGRWTVTGLGWSIGSALCHSHELTKAGR
ncbi:hypothetical protein [Streptomyces sp. cg35]|uniref:hypothetical protein n=1 Tax=Streptomyces sp. cg35 TaxID=3421650 RepID=UPI003D170476